MVLKVEAGIDDLFVVHAFVHVEKPTLFDVSRPDAEPLPPKRLPLLPLSFPFQRKIHVYCLVLARLALVGL